MLSLILLKRNLLTCKLLANFGMTVHCLGSGSDIWLFPIFNLTFEKNIGFILDCVSSAVMDLTGKISSKFW